jgi:hypothetical protein
MMFNGFSREEKFLDYISPGCDGLNNSSANFARRLSGISANNFRNHWNPMIETVQPLYARRQV